MGRSAIFLGLGLYLAFVVLAIMGAISAVDVSRFREASALTLIGLVTASGIPAIILILVLLWAQLRAALARPSFLWYPIVPIAGAAVLLLGALSLPWLGAALSIAVVIVCAFLGSLAWRQRH